MSHPEFSACNTSNSGIYGDDGRPQGATQPLAGVRLSSSTSYTSFAYEKFGMTHVFYSFIANCRLFSLKLGMIHVVNRSRINREKY